MNEKEKAIRRRLIEDFPFYSEHALKIKTKSQGVLPFKLNQAQLYVHNIVEEQLEREGYVRVLVLKGRQQGMSTYIGGRGYWRVSQSLGRNARVLAHNTDTSGMLFNMVRTFHDKCPKDLKPSTRAASAKEYDFDELDSGYRVSTAGSAEGGRGGTVQYLHGSEVAFWDKANEIFAGMMQSVPSGKDMVGTEIFLESTANGPRGKFYELWKEADSGNSEYIPIFIPWHWQDEYAIPIKQGDTPAFTEEEIAYQKDTGITNEQLLWRRYKIAELGERKFKQEYPRSAQEAFEYSEDGTFFDRDKVMEAARDKGYSPVPVGARVGACDPAGDGINADRTAVGWGDDTAIREVIYWEGLDEYQIAKRCEDYITQNNLDVFWVDAVGLGSGVYAMMKNGRHARTVRPFKGSGSTSTIIDGKEVYANRRAESAGRFREWLSDGTSVQIPNIIDLIDDICAPLEEVNEKTGKIQVESKKDMKTKRGIRSPDGLDVCCMIKCEKINKNLTNATESGMVLEEYNVLDYGL